MDLYASKMNDNGTIAVDDSILIKGVQAAYGSKILTGFKSLFSAEAVTRLEDKGYVISGKTHVGEFGLDLVGEFSHFAPQEGKLAAAAPTLIAQGEVKAALGVDVNGATRRGAALAGIDFLKPTYGTVSRYGIISTVASGEQVGVYASNAEDIAQVLEVISGHDDKDGTSLKKEAYEYSTKEPVADKKVAVVKELAELADDATKAKIAAFTESLKKAGVVVEEISADMFEAANVAYQIALAAETCNNISRYDGVKFGFRAETYRNIDELYVNTRTEGFNFLTKAVILYGSDVLSKERYKDCYDKTLRIRRVISEKFASLMESYDAVLAPVCSKAEYMAYDIGEAFEKVYEEGVFTSLANFIGIPALTAGGVQLMGKHFNENLLLSMAAAVEKEVR